MHAGDKWEVVIPAELGYGSRANGEIPGNSTLVFEIELVSIA
jgi:FKBP-type peptidyl-prolyl cis-trans isomerase